MKRASRLVIGVLLDEGEGAPSTQRLLEQLSELMAPWGRPFLVQESRKESAPQTRGGGGETRSESAETVAVEAALEQSRGNVSRAARLLGIGRTTLYERMRRLGIRSVRQDCQTHDLAEALEETGGDVTQTAHRLGVSRGTVWARLCRYGLVAGNDAAGAGKPLPPVEELSERETRRRARREIAVQLRQQGMTLQAIGKQLRVSSDQARRLLKEAGCGTGLQPSPRSRQRREQASRLRAEGLTLEEIGKRLGVTKEWARQLLKASRRQED